MSALRRAEEVLDEALGRMGARPLAYLPDFHFALRQQVMDLIEAHPKTLRLSIQSYTYNDGRSSRVLVAQGTVPMYYRSAQYNLPLTLRLPERFPLAAPLASLNPSADMVINAANPHVAPDGAVRSDYAQNWGYPGSNLRDFVEYLCIAFADVPPLYKRRPGDAPAPAAATTQAAAAAAAAAGFHATNPLAAGAAAAAGGAPPPPPPVASFWAGAMQAAARPEPPPPPPPPPPAGASPWQGVMAQQTAAAAAAAQQRREAQTADVRARRDAAFRGALSAALAARLGAALEARDGAEVARLAATARELRGRAAALGAEAAALQRQRERADAEAGEFAAAGAALDAWLAANEPKAEAVRAAAGAGEGGGAGGFDPDEAVVPIDALAAQALHAQATALALEDALSALDEVLEAGRLQVDAYLRQVRVACRLQFTARAVGNTVAAQQLAAAAAAAPRPPAPPPPPPPPGGQSWLGIGGLNPLSAGANRRR